jgi:hypothetical protein
LRDGAGQVLIVFVQDCALDFFWGAGWNSECRNHFATNEIDRDLWPLEKWRHEAVARFWTVDLRLVSRG